MGMRLKKTCRDVKRVISPLARRPHPHAGLHAPAPVGYSLPLPTGASFPVSFHALLTCPPRIGPD